MGLLFGLYPELDLRLAAIFYDPQVPGTWNDSAWILKVLRDIARWIVALVAAPAFIALIVKLIAPRRPMLIPGRAAVLMIATLALAPGLLTNILLKDQWGRPRPIDVTEFGGTDRFVPWWDPRGGCPKNCSFVAGEPSGAFWTLAPALLTPPHWRALATGGALAFGSGVGLLRMWGGGHFFSDVVFAGVFTFLVIWLVHGLLYRWRRTRTSDAAVDGMLERMIMSQRAALMRIRSGRRDPASARTSEQQRKE